MHEMAYEQHTHTQPKINSKIEISQRFQIAVHLGLFQIYIFKSTKSKFICGEKGQFNSIISVTFFPVFSAFLHLCVSISSLSLIDSLCLAQSQDPSHVCSFSLVPMIYYGCNLKLSVFPLKPMIERG